MGNRFRRSIVLVAVSTLALGLIGDVRAEPVGPLPGSCSPHATHVVPPGCVPAATSELREPGVTLPNLVPDVQTVFILPYELDETSQMLVPGPPTLYFDTWAQNFGSVPVQLTVENIDDPDHLSVRQCVSWTQRVCRHQETVGGYTYHDDHAHFHFEEFATYELRRLASDGRPDYSVAGRIDGSDKVSFCMIDSERVRDDAAPAPFYRTCLPTVQGISPGWADIYDGGLPGQQLSLEGLPDGRYALVVTVNYAGRLYETTADDNVVEIIVEVSAGATQAAIVGRHYP